MATFVAPGVARGLWERSFRHLRFCFVTFGRPLWCLGGPLWSVLGAFGRRFGLYLTTLGNFRVHFEEILVSLGTVCSQRLNLGRHRISLEIRCSEPLWGSPDRHICVNSRAKVDPRGARRGRRGHRLSKKDRKRLSLIHI